MAEKREIQFQWCDHNLTMMVMVSIAFYVFAFGGSLMKGSPLVAEKKN